ncbi:hypothetical protein EPH95_09915 [Salicibibacter halophilus]|uniref:Uncharacterized protein n=1 Tax=Salicibibacter halophilus TaxID=2502791 RepID=A0A514LI07_9BACI|nr:hypothetical protein [Salicibibacter halophilus]QDI91459.1 hypothetical protein EPH95_09915 [Salicibibacter halophilus]
MNHRICWSSLEYGTWSFYLAATEHGLCYMGSPNLSFEELKSWADRAVANVQLVRDDRGMHPYLKEEGLK